jgi:hypothetical protein
MVVIFLSCFNKNKEISTAFYHWKSNSDISDFEKTYLQHLKTEKIYTRLFDVDWDDEAGFPKPIAEVQNVSSTKFKTLSKFVPVVFITNKTFVQIADNQLDTFTDLVLNRIKSISSIDAVHRVYTLNSHTLAEIQIDCDWTERTHDTYFLFLKKLKSRIPPHQILSVTLRLHQVKDRTKTGIPPVDRAMLMCYNMASLDDPATENSILNPNLLRGYLKNIGQYPLPLDIALPLFSWGVVLRDGAAIKIINNLNHNEIDSNFNKKTDNRYVLMRNSYFKGHYLYENDEIRLENTPLSYLTETADFLSQNIKKQPLTLAFYHLDSTVLKRYTYDYLEDIINRFKK